MTPARARLATGVLLTLVVVLAGGLRVTHLDWDGGAHLNPDERYLTMVTDRLSAPSGPRGYLDTDGSPLNPANHGDEFVYGTAPLFATKAAATWLERGAVHGDQPARAVVVGLDRLGVPLLDDDGTVRFDDGYQSLYVGRLLAALVDTLTTLAVFELARLAAGRRAALAAALVWATCPLAIQYAHFFVTDAWVTGATAWALVAAAHLARSPGPRRRRALLVAGGLATGVAGASKVAGLSVGAALVAALVAAAWPTRPAADLRTGRGWWRTTRALGPGLAGGAALVAVVAGLTFRVLQPYAFDGFGLDPRWTEALRKLGEVQAGADVPPNVQWADRSKLEPLGWLVRFGFGIPATMLALVGLAGLVPRWRLRPPARPATPAGAPEERAPQRTRPVATVLVSWLVVCAAIFLPRWVVSMRYLLPAYPALAVFAGAGAAHLLARSRRPPARVAGAVLVLGAVTWGLAFVHGVYGQPHPRLTAARWLGQRLEPGQVVTFDEWDDVLPFSAVGVPDPTGEPLRPFGTQTPDDVRDLAASLARADYVVQTSDRASASVTRVPGRYAPVLRYQAALEDGSLGFDLVATFRTRPQLFGIGVDDTGSEEAFRVYDHPTVRIWRKADRFDLVRALAILQPDRADAAVRPTPADAAANGLLLRRGAASDPGTVEGPTFDDLFGRHRPLAPVWWLAWWELCGLAAAGWLAPVLRALPDRGLGLAKVLGPFTVVLAAWGLVAWGGVRFSTPLVAALSAALVAVSPLARRWRRSWRELWVEHRRTVLTVEALTVAVFLAALLLRAAIPDLWFHPTGGEKPFETAFFTSVARTSSLPPADPWFSGGSMNYYYGSWFALAVPTRLLGLRPEVALNLGLATTASLVAAAAFTVGTALAGPRRARRDATGDDGPPAEDRPVGPAGRPRLLAGVLAALAVLAVGNLDAARQQVDRAWAGLHGRPAATFDWWGTSRLHPPTSDINEFPAWSFLFGDPHPHVLSLPVLVTIVALLLAYVLTARAGGPTGPIAGALGVGLAWVRVSHTWDLPILAGLAVAALATGALVRPPAAGRRARARATALDAALLVGLALTVTHPYVHDTQVFDRGLTTTDVRTPVRAYLLQYGTALALAVVFLGGQVRARWRAGAVERRSLGGGALALLGLGVAAAGMRGPSAGIATALAISTAVAAVTALRRGDTGTGLAAALVAAGAALSLLPEAWIVINDIGRQNTVFKFGYTAWVLTALGSAALAVRWAADGATSPPAPRIGRGVAVAALLVPGLVFWPSALPRRLEARFADHGLTLDGRDWLRHGPLTVEANEVPPIDVTADEPLITWLRAHGHSGETIVEATGPSYTWVGRVSVATGLPTVVGWQFHEKQQRRDYGVWVDQRVAAVGDLYGRDDPERMLRVLATYRPDYVVVGTVERALGDPDALATLARLRGLHPAFRAPGGAVYRVDLGEVDTLLARIDADRIRRDEAADVATT